MAAFIIVGVYIVVGLVAVISVPSTTQPKIVGHAVMLVCWPFLLPAALASQEVRQVQGKGSHRVEELARQMRQLISSNEDAPGREARERAILDLHVDRLLSSEKLIREMDAALFEAHASVKDRLLALRNQTEQELLRDTQLLEELVAQLTLLRFASPRGVPDSDRSPVEELLGRMEALTQLGR